MSSDENNSENDNQNNYDLIEYNKKNYKMSLLFIQTKELKRLYYSKMENSLKKYYLVDKSWLDDYKSKNNYKSADMFDSFNDWKNYEDFKEVMGDSFLVDDDYFTRLFKKVKCKIGNYKNKEYPKNIELVCEEYFNDCFKGSVTCPLYDILIGNKSIIMFDPENKRNNKDITIYICNRIGKEEDFNFLVKVIYIIVFDNLEIMNEELKEICSSEGVNNYLSKRNLKINDKEQNIINSKNEKIGKFMVVYEETSPSESLVIDIKNPIFNLNKKEEKEEGINDDLNNNTKMILNESLNMSNNNNINNHINESKNKNVVVPNTQNKFIDNNNNNDIFQLNGFSNLNLGNQYQNNNINNDFIDDTQNNQKMLNSSPNINNNIMNLNNINTFNGNNNSKNDNNNNNKITNNNNLNFYDKMNFSTSIVYNNNSYLQNNNNNLINNNYNNNNNYNMNNNYINSTYMNNNYNIGNNNYIYDNYMNANYNINNNINNNNMNNNYTNNNNFNIDNNNINKNYMNNNYNINNNNINNNHINDNLISNNISNINYMNNNKNINYNDFNDNMNYSNNNNILNNNNNNINNSQQLIGVKIQNINNNSNNIEYTNLNDNNFKEEDNDEFNLHFKYKKKEVVLYIKSNMKFSEIKSELLKNYESFRNIKIKGFLYNNELINDESTCEELNIKSDSKIIIIEE